jgi:hypothetical protein
MLAPFLMELSEESAQRQKLHAWQKDVVLSSVHGAVPPHSMQHERVLHSPSVDSCNSGSGYLCKSTRVWAQFLHANHITNVGLS